MNPDATHTQGTPRWAVIGEGRRLFYMERPAQPGARAPTIVFEAGMAASRSCWALVQRDVSAWARTIVYDRSGLGRSPPDDQRRSLERMSGDLNHLLDQVGPGPFILVAHSAGGPIVRAAAAARSERITGLVLVDVSDEASDVFFEPSFRRLERRAQAATTVLARLGLLGWVYRAYSAAFPPDVREDLRREGFTVQVARTRGAELQGHVLAMESLRAHPLETPATPAVVISGALADGAMTPRIRAAANAAHAYRASRFQRGRHVIAPRSGHMVILTEPALIAQEIRSLAEGAVA